MPEDRRLAAIMFTDIVGYTALMGSDEDKAFDILKRNHAIHENLINKYNGTLIKEIGDGTLASFPLASNAVRCAMEIQKEAKDQDIPLKIGIHQGEMVMVGADVLGDGVNVASRLQEASKEGCITISGKVYSDIRNKAGIKAKYIEEKKLKNVDDPVKVYEILCEEEEVKPAKGKVAKSKIKTLYYIIAGIIIVLAGVIIWQFLPTKETSPTIAEVVDKSIAVLPFRNDSPDQENEYFCNGMMESILTNLQKIGDLRIKSRTDVEQYRDPEKDLKSIAKELKVAFILEGSVQKVGDNIRITAQLIEGSTGDHLWAENYDGKYTDEIFKFQSDIAIKIATALNVAINAEEKQKLVTPPTISVTAYDYILRARDEKWKYWYYHDTVALKNAERLYDKALKLDPNYAPAWLAKGSIYLNRYGGSEEYYEENYLDSVFWYCKKASQLDPESDFMMKAIVYHRRGDIKSAIHYYEKSIKNDESAIEAMWRLGYIYIYNKDYQKGFSLIRKGVQTAKASPNDYGYHLYRLAYAYLWMGDYEAAENYYIQSRDMGAWFLPYCYFYYYQADFRAALDCSMNCSTTPSEDWCLYLVGNTYFQLGDFDNAAKYYKQFREVRNARGRIQWDNLYREGIALIELGMKEEGMKLIDKQLSQLEKRKTLGRLDGYDYHLAAIYAYRGDQEKALKCLQEYENKMLFPDHNRIPIYFTQYDILFKPLWNNPEFKALLKQELDEKEAGRAKVRELMESGDTDL